MQIGICTRYDRHENAYLATIFADWLHVHGFEVSLFVPNTVKHYARQGRRWDDKKHWQGDKSFTAWSATQSAILWMIPPTLPQLAFVQGRNIPCYAVFDPAASDVASRAAYTQVDKLLTLNREMSAACHNYPGYDKNYFSMPVTPASPIYTRTSRRDKGKPVVLWPVFDGDWRRYNSELLPVVENFLRKHSDEFTLRISLSSRDLPGQFRRTVQRWSRKYKSVELQTCRDIRWRDLTFHDAAVTLWPSLVENAMLRALTSYTYGVPVVGFMYPPNRELLAANTELCPSLAMSRYGQYTDEQDYGSEQMIALMQKVMMCVHSPAMLAEASENVTRYIVARTSMFSRAMSELFE